METMGNNTVSSTHQEKAKKMRKLRRWQIIVSLFGVAVIVWGVIEIVFLFLGYKQTETSNDAQIEQYVSPVNLRASVFPFAPACAKPRKVPTTTMLSDAITSAPEFTSPIITMLPSVSSLCPERNEPLWNFVSDIAISCLNVRVILDNPRLFGISKSISTSIFSFINS